MSRPSKYTSISSEHAAVRGLATQSDCNGASQVGCVGADPTGTAAWFPESPPVVDVCVWVPCGNRAVAPLNRNRNNVMGRILPLSVPHRIRLSGRHVKFAGCIA